MEKIKNAELSPEDKTSQNDGACSGGSGAESVRVDDDWAARYRVHKQCKVIRYGLPLYVSPFLLIGAARYKKRYLALPIIYTLFTVLGAVFLIMFCVAMGYFGMLPRERVRIDGYNELKEKYSVVLANHEYETYLKAASANGKYSTSWVDNSANILNEIENIKGALKESVRRFGSNLYYVYDSKEKADDAYLAMKQRYESLYTEITGDVLGYVIIDKNTGFKYCGSSPSTRLDEGGGEYISLVEWVIEADVHAPTLEEAEALSDGNYKKTFEADGETADSIYAINGALSSKTWGELETVIRLFDISKWNSGQSYLNSADYSDVSAEVKNYKGDLTAADYIKDYDYYAGKFAMTIAAEADTDTGIIYMIIGAIALCLGFIVWIISLVNVVKLASHGNRVIDGVKREVYEGEGTEAVKAFEKALIEKSKQKDTDGFNAVLSDAHNRYLPRKDMIMTYGETAAAAKKIESGVILTESKEKAKEIKARIRSLYEARDFEAIHALYDEYGKKFDEAKADCAESFTPEHEGKSTFDGTVLQRLGWTLLGCLITGASFGICFPFALCMIKKWETSHTVINGRRLSFDGTGGQLMGKWMIWGLLAFVTLGIYSFKLAKNVEEWTAKHTHMAGEPDKLGSTFDGMAVTIIGMNVLVGFVSLVTLGWAFPAAYCYREKWLTEHRVYDGRRMTFDGTGGRLMGKYLLWALLTVVTLGIFSLWLPIKMKKWKTEHTILTDAQECVL